MKITRLLITALLSLGLLSSCRSEAEKSAYALADRILGEKAGAVAFEQTDGEGECYELSQAGDKVLIKGTNALSMAVGLNRYLQEYCLTNVSWYDYNPVELPDVMPAVEGKVEGCAEMDVRFFLNYCTFGYTLPWWGWKEWERFIDWMALNGVNMPLAITGQEAVWQKVWRKYGMSDEQIRAFFTGPAHLPWQRMCNLDYWQGPLPQSWIDKQADLQKQILKRERQFGMTPVLPAFSGHLPKEVAEASSVQLDTFRVSYWGGFADEYRCTFLSPMDPAFAQIQKDFLEEQTRMYGSDHIYGVDPFNEVDAPFWDPETLARISSDIYSSLTAADPDAEWLQMGWLFYDDEVHWTDENIKAYLTAVPQGKMTVLDYYCDHTQVWKRTESFYGQNFIWCYLGNFGGMTGIEGDFFLNEERIEDTAENAGPGFVGVGATLEGFGVNEPMYEAVLAQAWSHFPGAEAYIDNIADRHIGRKDEGFRAYWQQIAKNISRTHTSTSASSIICAHPSLEGNWHRTTKFRRGYELAELEKAVAMIDAVEGNSAYLEYDKVNVNRQLLNDKALLVRDRFTAAYRKGNRAEMVKAKAEFLAICDELVELLSNRKEFSLDHWVESARSWGDTPEEKDYFEINARTLISVWGDSYDLCDYANRDFDGLVKTYYKPRWEMFFDAVIAAFDAGEPFGNSKSRGSAPYGSDESVGIRALQFDKDIWEFENTWAGL